MGSSPHFEDGLRALNVSPKKKKKTSSESRKKGKPAKALDPLRTGMPALDSIVEVKEPKKGKGKYRLIRTNEVDEYEKRTSEKNKVNEKK